MFSCDSVSRQSQTEKVLRHRKDDCEKVLLSNRWKNEECSDGGFRRSIFALNLLRSRTHMDLVDPKEGRLK